MYKWTRRRIARELVAASRRGVDVRLVVDASNEVCVGPLCFEREAIGILRGGLPRGHLRLCGKTTGGCVGSRIQHNKFFLFSALADGSVDVVAQSSANLTGSQRRQGNNLVVLRGDAALYRAYAAYWDALHAGRRRGFSRAVRGDTGARVLFFPQAPDPVLSLLSDVSCETGGEIRVAMAFFRDSRIELAERLAALQRRGCEVRAVLRTRGPTPGRRVTAALRSGDVDVRGLPTLHSKYLLIDVPSASGTRRRIVATGSHNYTGAALSRNDETMLVLEDASTYAAFARDFERLQARAEAL